MLTTIALIGTVISTILGTIVGFRKGAGKHTDELEQAKAVIDVLLPVVVNLPGVKTNPAVQSYLKGNYEPCQKE